jgi:uncharacterized protein YfcZ (UPF0381/DUF406 family)
MTKIDFEKDRMQSVKQIDSAKRLSDKVLELKDLEDEIANAEESLKKLKEKAKEVSSVFRKINRKQLSHGFVTTV